MTELIRPGDHNEKVKDVQSRLRSLGHDIVDAAGYFGGTTKRAVRAFQQQREILIDGIVGPNTWNELVEASWRLGDRTLYLRHPYLRGDDVNTLQARLNALGFDSGREDGIFGPETDVAVRAFQKEYATAEDGIFGPASHAALAGLRVDRPGTSAKLREELKKDLGPRLEQAVVVIDPGHGGTDPGEVGTRGNREADLCWELSTRLAEQLSIEGARVRFTHTEAEAPDSSERARRANELQGDILVSIHLNSHEEWTAEGASTYFFGGSHAGQTLAEKILDELVMLGARDCRSHARSYTLLRETRMPAVLVEPAFISNPDEEKKLEDSDHLNVLASSIVAAIRRYHEESL
ncbi:MAG TPA: N-acetylmuramoyl-L-alanine amidase [Actinomycetota bacterium]|nr:N-acetylmuramoyl-L-alanine amidase [Actinomycetota bacterium]